MGTEGGTKAENGRGKERRVKDYVLTSSVHSQVYFLLFERSELDGK